MLCSSFQESEIRGGVRHGHLSIIPPAPVKRYVPEVDM